MEIVAREAGMPEVRADAVAEMTSLISERFPYFQRMAFRCVDNTADAEDAVQDAFLCAWKHLDKFKGEAQMSTWLTAIVMNAARMVLRKRSRSLLLPFEGHGSDEETPSFSETLSDTSPDPECQVRRLELEDRLRRLSVHLPPKLREVIRLRGIEGLSIRETADVLGLTESAVKTRAARARENLRQLDERNPALGPGAVARGPATRRRRRKIREVSAAA